MPLDGDPLPAVAAAIVSAHAAALAADRLATLAVKVELKKRIAAGELIAKACVPIPPERTASAGSPT
jgi:hypothetical protein